MVRTHRPLSGLPTSRSPAANVAPHKLLKTRLREERCPVANCKHDGTIDAGGLSSARLTTVAPY